MEGKIQEGAEGAPKPGFLRESYHVQIGTVFFGTWGNFCLC
jgi:hypothetical protein